MLCSRVSSHSLLPSLRRIQGRRKGGWQKALSRDQARGSKARLCLHHAPFHRHNSPGTLSGAEHLTVPQLPPQTAQPTPPPSSQHEGSAVYSSSGTLGQHDRLKCVDVTTKAVQAAEGMLGRRWMQAACGCGRRSGAGPRPCSTGCSRRSSGRAGPQRHPAVTEVGHGGDTARGHPGRAAGSADIPSSPHGICQSRGRQWESGPEPRTGRESGSRQR